MIKGLINRIGQSTFLKNVIIVMTGTGISQAIALLSMPILARNYLPADFGFLMLYLGLYSIISGICTGKYERVILLGKSSKEVNNASILCFFIGSISSLFSFITILVIDIWFLENIGIDEAFFEWFYLFPFFILVTTINLICLTYLNYLRRYRVIALSRVIKTFSGTIVGLLCIFFLRNAGGLILAEFLGWLFATIYLYPTSREVVFSRFKRINKDEIMELAKRYRNFPIYTIPSDLINSLAVQLPGFFLMSFYGASTTGFYSLMKRVLDAPIALLSSSILEVFRQQAVYDYNSKGSCRIIFLKTARSLTLVSVLPFTILFLFGPYLFKIVFGEEWEMAGYYARIFSVFYFFKFISSPLSYMLYIAEVQKVDFVLHIYILFSTLIIFCIPNFWSIESVKILWIYTINFSFIYLFYLYYSYRLTTNKSI